MRMSRRASQTPAKKFPADEADGVGVPQVRSPHPLCAPAKSCAQQRQKHDREHDTTRRRTRPSRVQMASSRSPKAVGTVRDARREWRALRPFPDVAEEPRPGPRAQCTTKPTIERGLHDETSTSTEPEEHRPKLPTDVRHASQDVPWAAASATRLAVASLRSLS
jgi:hypothetical protein